MPALPLLLTAPADSPSPRYPFPLCHPSPDPHQDRGQSGASLHKILQERLLTDNDNNKQNTPKRFKDAACFFKEMDLSTFDDRYFFAIVFDFLVYIGKIGFIVG